MATSGQLIETVASAFGIPEVTVHGYYRSLREAGLVEKAGRGPRSGAKMQPTHAAQLLLSAVAGRRTERDPPSKFVRDFEGVVLAHTSHRSDGAGAEPGWSGEENEWKLADFDLPHLRTLGPRHRFQDALAALITEIVDGNLEKNGAHSIDVAVYGPEPQAQIALRFFNNENLYTEEATYLLIEQIDKNPGNYVQVDEGIRERFGDADLEMRNSFTWKTLYKVADLLKEGRNEV